MAAHWETVIRVLHEDHVHFVDLEALLWIDGLVEAVEFKLRVGQVTARHGATLTSARVARRRQRRATAAARLVHLRRRAGSDAGWARATLVELELPS